MWRKGQVPYDRVKRVLDVLGAVGILVTTAPLQIGVAAVVLVAHGRPVLFRQQRPGWRGEVFQLVKFRTMRHPDATHVTDEQRLTRTGRFLRATSWDELPSLWNVVKGDMSLVGPRPLLVCYLDRYTTEQARRHEVRPGITGLAQVMGRNSLSWEEKFKLDVDYVDGRGLALDCRILLHTFRVVAQRSGINQDGHVTVSEFMGSQGHG